ncbi:type I-E CRISPR-associated protein Cse2/CasB [Rhodocyclus purpureus]|uniref:type I-E CRISPR-associated protein Cse2/CasB n=1 Tax=Rhodocyclus purpureus TaxID=1067 RepID=UPI001912395F|nr:type I-E CRISPR-associated protein Cse2/CasB [Rhodocyclus purpureus]MBK5913910.1 type I-E CRISPR-associated protein Cse2/CasB [Rhodocyclus purpureus]
MSELTPVIDKLASWWHGLEDARGDRALLRRAGSLTDVALSAPYQRLYRQLVAAGWDSQSSDERNDRLAAVVGLLAHVKEDSQQALPEAMSARPRVEDKPPVSELRFQRLLESPDIESLFSSLRRVLPLMNNRVDVKALANDVLYWGDSIKKRWAYDYVWPQKSR